MSIHEFRRKYPKKFKENAYRGGAGEAYQKYKDDIDALNNLDVQLYQTNLAKAREMYKDLRDEVLTTPIHNAVRDVVLDNIVIYDVYFKVVSITDYSTGISSYYGIVYRNDDTYHYSTYPGKPG
jgi:hypothetical protein